MTLGLQYSESGHGVPTYKLWRPLGLVSRESSDLVGYTSPVVEVRDNVYVEKGFP